MQSNIVYFMEACICSHSVKTYFGMMSKFRVAVNSGKREATLWRNFQLKKSKAKYAKILRFEEFWIVSYIISNTFLYVCTKPHNIKYFKIDKIRNPAIFTSA